MEKSGLISGGVFGAAVVGVLIWTGTQVDIKAELAGLLQDPYDLAPRAQVLYYSGYSQESPEMQGWEYSPHDEENLLFYGAVAVSGVDYGYWVEDFHDLGTARIAALEWCNYDLPEDEPPCEIIADIIPAPEVDIENLIAGLSAIGQVDYASYRGEPRSKAFAISLIGGYGWSWGNLNPSLAEVDAIQQCNIGNEDLPRFDGIDNTCFIFDLNGEILVPTE